MLLFLFLSFEIIMKSYHKSIETNHCRAGLKRSIYFLSLNGYKYKGHESHKILQEQFEKITGLKKPAGIKFRKWMGELYRQESPFLPATPKRNKFAKYRKPKKKKVDRRQEYESYIKGPIWRAFRERAFEFYGRSCAKCGSIHKLHVHHKHYKTLFNEGLGDVMILCEPCHEEEHGRKFIYS